MTGASDFLPIVFPLKFNRRRDRKEGGDVLRAGLLVMVNEHRWAVYFGFVSHETTSGLSKYWTSGLAYRNPTLLGEYSHLCRLLPEKSAPRSSSRSGT
jgi:hypothetical protein